MKRFFALVKLMLIQHYRFKPSEDKKTRLGTIFLVGVVVLCCLPLVASFVLATYYLGKLGGMDAGICAMLILACQALVLLFGLPSIITNIFNGRDAHKLLYMPARPTMIFASKLTAVYVNEVITSAFSILIILLPYGIGAHASCVFYLMIPFAIIAVPMLPLLAGALIAMPLSAVFARLKNGTVWRTIVQIFFYVLIMAAYILLMYFMEFSGNVKIFDTVSAKDMAQNLISQVHDAAGNMVYVHPVMMLATCMTSISFGAWAVTGFVGLLESVLLVGLVLLISWPFYRWILFASVEGFSSHKPIGKYAALKRRSVLNELMYSDLKRVSRNSQMGFQAFGGLILMPLILVVFYFVFNRQLESGLSTIESLSNNIVYQVIAPLVIVAYMSLLGIGSNFLGLYPISRENKSLYLLKSLPIDFRKILLAKVLLSTSVMLICDFLTCVLAGVLFRITWYYCIVMMATMALLGFGAMCVTTLLDLKAPRLGWTNFNQGLKNGRNSWIAMLIGLVVGAALAIIALCFIIWFVRTLQVASVIVMWLCILIFSALFAGLAYKFMSDRAQQFFEKIEP